MIDSLSAARKRRRFAQFAAAAAIFLAVSPAAKAQGLFFNFGGGPGPTRYDIERRLDANGYSLTGPVVRRGDVYLADVVFGGRDYERLVIDAWTGRIMERYRTRPARWRAASPRPSDQDQSDFWGPPRSGSWDEPPRPPADIDRPGPMQDRMARGDEGAPPIVIPGLGGQRGATSDLIEKPKPRPRPHEAARKATPPTPVAKATVPPPAAPAGMTPSTTTGTVPSAPTTESATPSASPAAENAPPVATPSAPAQSAKADAPASPVAAKPSPPAPLETPKAAAPSKSKAVNDVPVTPLD